MVGNRIGENICTGYPEATLKEAIAVGEQAGAHQLLKQAIKLRNNNSRQGNSLWRKTTAPRNRPAPYEEIPIADFRRSH